MKLQKKSLEHVSKTLDTYDTYPMYRELSTFLSESEIPEDKKKAILNIISNESTKLKSIVRDSKSWIDAIIEDLG